LSGLSSLPPSARRTDSSTLSAQDSQRLEELKRQKEAERLERERAMWREASRLPRILEEMLEPAPPKEPENSPPAPPEQGEQKEPGGFFSKLRHGKFLI
jgi:transposase